MTQRPLLIALPLLLLLAVLWGCENDTSNDITGPGGGDKNTCLGCHASEDALKEALGEKGEPVLPVANKDDG